MPNMYTWAKQDHETKQSLSRATRKSTRMCDSGDTWWRHYTVECTHLYTSHEHFCLSPLLHNPVFDQGTPKLDVFHQESPVSAGPKKNLLRWRWSLRRSKSCWCRNPAPEEKDSSLYPISQVTALKSVVQLTFQCSENLIKTMQFCHCHCNSEVNDVECILATVHTSNKSITVTFLFFNSMEKWNLTTKSGDSTYDRLWLQYCTVEISNLLTLAPFAEQQPAATSHQIPPCSCGSSALQRWESMEYVLCNIPESLCVCVCTTKDMTWSTLFLLTIQYIIVYISIYLGILHIALLRYQSVFGSCFFGFLYLDSKHLKT